MLLFRLLWLHMQLLEGKREVRELMNAEKFNFHWESFKSHFFGMYVCLALIGSVQFNEKLRSKAPSWWTFSLKHGNCSASPDLVAEWNTVCAYILSRAFSVKRMPICCNAPKGWFIAHHEKCSNSNDVNTSTCRHAHTQAPSIGHTHIIRMQNTSNEARVQE